jgi:hypothetical protein
MGKEIIWSKKPPEKTNENTKISKNLELEIDSLMKWYLD